MIYIFGLILPELRKRVKVRVKLFLMAEDFYSDEYRRFESVLRGIRAERDLTQAQIAQSMGIFQGRVSRFESGERRMDFIELRRWCIAVGVPIEEFIRRFDEAIQRAK